MPKEITLDETEFRKAWDAGLSYPKMAKQFGCSTHTIMRTAVKLACPKRAAPKKHSSHARNMKKAKTLRDTHALTQYGEPVAPKPITLKPFAWDTPYSASDTYRRAWRDRVADMAAQGVPVTEIARDLQCMPIDVANEVERAGL